MSEYVKLKTVRKIVCSVCKEYAPPGDCPKDCAWMRRLKENATDVVEVMHGEWLGRRGGFFDFATCSNCKEDYPLGGDTLNYCPNCGARMDGADND